jgi:hypothetical protein
VGVGADLLALAEVGRQAGQHAEAQRLIELRRAVEGSVDADCLDTEMHVCGRGRVRLGNTMNY